MTKPEISGIAPLFIVNNVPAALAFYRDRLGFDVTFQGPEPVTPTPLQTVSNIQWKSRLRRFMKSPLAPDGDNRRVIRRYP